LIAVETLTGVATCGEGGGGGLEVHMIMNLMPPGVSKVSFFSPYFGSFIRAFQNPFLLLLIKKDTYNDIFARKLLQPK
jgi:hypothetical protein